MAKAKERAKVPNKMKPRKPREPVVFDPKTAHIDDEGFAEVPMSDIVPAVEWAEIGQSAVGVLETTQENIGENDSRLLIMRGDDGQFSVWESKGLEKLFDLAETYIGKTLKIVYHSDVKVKKRRQPMKVFKVFMK